MRLKIYNQISQEDTNISATPQATSILNKIQCKLVTNRSDVIIYSVDNVLFRLVILERERQAARSCKAQTSTAGLQHAAVL